MLITRTNPVGVDLKIQQIQTALHAHLVSKWGLADNTVYACYGRAYRNKLDTGYIAEVFTGGKDYREVYWNDTLSAISFFHKSDTEANEKGFTKVDISIIFFVNVATLKPTITHRADEEVRQDVRQFFGLSNYGFQFSGIETGIDNVLKEYPGTRKSEGLKVVDMQPVHAFRINGTLTFRDKGCSISGSLRLPDSIGALNGGNFTDFTFDQLTGDITWIGSDPGSSLTSLVFKDPAQPASYINGEGVGFSIGLLPGMSYDEAIPYLTPGQVIFQWRRVTPQGVALSEVVSKTITITRLARRWYHLYRTVTVGSGSQFYDTYPGFTLKVYNVEGDLIGTYSTIETLITAWNADPANVNFQIIGYRTLNTFYEVQFEPDASETAYPIQHITVSL